MIVQCDKCSRSYKLNADKLPAQGGRIACPECKNVFFVAPRQESFELPKAVEKPVSSGEDMSECTWKLRLAGLTYAFQGLENLHDWLLARSSLEGVKIAKDDDDWGELGDYPGVMTTELITKFFPLGDVPTSKSGEELEKPASIAPTSEKLLSSDIPSTQMSVITAKKLAKPRSARQSAQKKAEMSQGFKIFLVLVLGLLICVGVLYWGGIISIDKFLPPSSKEFVLETPVKALPKGEPEAQAPSELVEAAQPAPVQMKPSLSPEELEAIEREAYEKQLALVEQHIKQRRWPEARAVVENLLLQHADDRAVNELALKIYRALNLNDDAERIRKLLATLPK
ncbi:MAG: zinc-ribbon domain-containing protein [Bradymonadia bacterium]|jgi:predicted Zn finger-like uncharacterized protein